MPLANVMDNARRSSRVPVTMPVLVTSAAPGADFSEICDTLVVNAHGCAIRSPIKLEAGIPLHIQNKDGRKAMAHVVDCEPMGSGQQGWKLGATLDRPQNFWGLKRYPDDWLPVFEMPVAEQQLSRKQPPRNKSEIRQTQDPPPQKAERDLQSIVSDHLQPVRAEIEELKNRLLQREPKRSQFDISLSHIPAEVEEKLEIRLREDLGTRVLQQTRQQSEEVLEAAKEAIGKKIREGQNEFRDHMAQELQTVSQQANTLSQDLAAAVRQQLAAGVENFQHRLSDAGTRLDQRSHELLHSLQQHLAEEHDTRRRELLEVQAAVVSESARLQSQISDLGSRVAALNETAHRLESGLDAHMAQVASDIVNAERGRLERAAAVVLKQAEERNAKQLREQCDHAYSRLTEIQSTIEGSIADLLKKQVDESLQAFEQTMEEMAQHSVGRWRLALARDLTSVATVLGEQIRSEAMCDESQSADSIPGGRSHPC